MIPALFPSSTLILLWRWPSLSKMWARLRRSASACNSIAARTPAALSPTSLDQLISLHAPIDLIACSLIPDTRRATARNCTVARTPAFLPKDHLVDIAQTFDSSRFALINRSIELLIGRLQAEPLINDMIIWYIKRRNT